MHWTKRFLIVSLIVCFASLVYSVVSFYRLRRLPEPVVIVEPDIPLRRNPRVLKPAKIPETEKSSESDSEPSNGEIALTEDEWEEDSEDFDALLTDAFTSTPEPLVDAEETTSKYPPVPADYPFTPIWLRSEAERAHIPPERLELQEILGMVMVKLWSEGDHDFTGGVITNGIFYPLYPDVAYVEWDQSERPDGTISWYVGHLLTGDNDSDAIIDQLENGETPAGIRIVDYKSAGIDPYQFLSN